MLAQTPVYLYLHGNAFMFSSNETTCLTPCRDSRQDSDSSSMVSVIFLSDILFLYPFIDKHNDADT